MHKAEIIEKIASARKKISGLGINKLSLFGSFSKGLQTDSSDIDFVVEFSSGMKSFDSMMELSFLLEELLGRKIDLVTKSSLDPFLSRQIDKELENVLLPA